MKKNQILRTDKEQQIEAAVNHFAELYADEIEAGEVTGSTIHEWWGMTVEQYSELKIDDFEVIKELILN